MLDCRPWNWDPNWRLASLATLVLACATAQPPPGTSAMTPASAATSDEPGAADGDARPSNPAPSDTGPELATLTPLPPNATYLDMLQGIAKREAEGTCLLVRQGGQLYLGAGEGLATRGWPETPDRLAALNWLGAAVDPSVRLRLITPYGIVGDASRHQDPALVSASQVPPTVMGGPAAALLLETPQRVALYFSDRPAQAIPSAAAFGALLGSTQAQPDAAISSLWIAAVKQTPAALIADLLRQVPSGLPVGFAVVLPQGTRLPSGDQSAAIGGGTADTQPVGQSGARRSSRCPGGLPAPNASDLEGDLPRDALMAGLAGFQEGARSCLQQAVGRAAGGGKLVLALRIGRHGQVQHSCLVEDPIGDDTLTACLTEHARLVRFPAPQPAGFVDVHVPVTLDTQPDPPTRPFCER